MRVPSLSLPVAVKLTASGAEPEDVDVASPIQTGDIFATPVVGVATGAVVAVGTVVVEPVGDGLAPVPVGEGVVSVHDLATIETSSGLEPEGLYTFSVSPSDSDREFTFVAVGSSSKLTVPVVGARGFIVTVPTSVVVVIALVISPPMLSVIVLPEAVSVGPSIT